jgi:hypothetical protein
MERFMPNEGNDNKKSNIKKIVSRIGTALMVLSLIFIVRRLINDEGFDRSLFEHLTSIWVIAALLLLAMIEGLGILAAGLNFRAIIKNVSGLLVDLRLALAVYTESNVYKYIPGSVMYVAGRNRLAIEVDELTHGKVVLSTIIEGVFFIFSVIVIAIIFAFDHFTTYIMQMDIVITVLLVLGTLVVAVTAIIYICRHRIGGKIKQMTDSIETISWQIIAKRLGFSLTIMFIYSLTFLFTLMLMGQEVTFDMGVALIGLYLLAWLAGFITPGVPSGIGIRELVMIMFMGDYISVGIIAATMVMHRVLTVIGDLAAFVFAKGLNKRVL